MFKIINYITWLIVAILLTLSCSSDAEMQDYFIKHQSDTNFLAIDIPSSVLGDVDNKEMAVDVKEALLSFKKLNVLAFKKTDSNVATFETEKKAVKKIIANKSYKDLMHFKDSANSVIIKYLGSDSSVDQFILFGSSDEKGFVLVRVLGDKMNVNKAFKLFTLAKSGKMDTSKIAVLKNFFN